MKRYSLGVKQRLGLAAALLKDPDLLMLDEPANGLDPAGMREVRQLLRRLADAGRTVFVSSHILAEIESTCDHVAILAQGRLVIHGTVEEVISTAGHRASVLVKVDDLDLGMWALRDAHFATEQVNGELRVDVSPDRAGDVTRILAAAGQWVTELRPDRFSLEDVFLNSRRRTPTNRTPSFSRVRRSRRRCARGGATGSLGGGVRSGDRRLAGHVTAGDVPEVVRAGVQDHRSAGDVGRGEPAGHRSR